MRVPFCWLIPAIETPLGSTPVELTTMTLTVPDHNLPEMHRMLACVALILSGVHKRDADEPAAYEQTKTRRPSATEMPALMALWRRTLVARRFSMTLPEMDAYATTLNHAYPGGRAPEETPALRTRGGPLFAVMTNDLGARVLRRRSGKCASSGAN